MVKAFFVAGDSTDGGTITFDNSQREYKVEGSGSSVFFKSSTSTKKTGSFSLPVIKLGMNFKDSKDGKSYHRQIAVSFNPNHNFAFDKGYDAEMFDVGATDIYWKLPSDDRKFVIAGVGSVSNDMQVPLEVVMGYSGGVSIMIDELKNVDQAIYLNDKVAGVSYNLLEDVASLNLESGTYTDRFFLAFQPLQVLSNEEEIVDSFTNIFVDNTHNNVVITKTRDIEIQKVRLYNILGKQVSLWDIKEQQPRLDLKLQRKLPMGVYIIDLQTDKGKLNKKVIIE